MRLIRIAVTEPLPGMVLPQMAAVVGEEEAARRYRAIVLTSLRQLRWLSDCRLRIEVTPNDAHDAVKFWLLPALSEKWTSSPFSYQADGWEIDFDGTDETPFVLEARADPLCPLLSARWIHAALIGFGQTIQQVIGHAPCGTPYFFAETSEPTAAKNSRVLPELAMIQHDDDWFEALNGPLGPMLKRAFEESQ